MPRFDVTERHARRFAAPPARVWEALFSADFSRSPMVATLMAIRMLPSLLTGRGAASWRGPRTPHTLRSLASAGFGILAEEPPREVVLGIEGRFWRPTGNIERFDRARFERPVEAGLARGVWNFSLERDPDGDGKATRLTTETRVLCGDAASRRKFRLYWLLVRPGSGLIRHAMLGAVRRELAS